MDETGFGEDRFRVRANALRKVERPKIEIGNYLCKQLPIIIFGDVIIRQFRLQLFFSL